MKARDYVRLERCQGINRIQEYDDDRKWFILEEEICDEYGDDTFVLDEKEVIKSSPNIMDVIKKNDILIDYNDNVYKVIKVFKNYAFTDKKNKYGQVITLVDYQIKKVITEDQFNWIGYEVK